MNCLSKINYYPDNINSSHLFDENIFVFFLNTETRAEFLPGDNAGSGVISP